MYYTLDNRTDKEVGNVFPQVDCINQELAHAIKFDAFLPNLDTEILFKLEPKAKLTDVLSQGAIAAHGLLVNRKVIDIFASFNLMKHKYYKCLVKDKKDNTHEYFFLHLADNFTEKIDYEKSIFYSTRSTFRQEEIKISSYEDYLKKQNLNNFLWGVEIDKISFDKSNNISHDLFSSIPFDMGIYITLKLKLALEEYNISGITIKEAVNIL